MAKRIAEIIVELLSSVVVILLSVIVLLLIALPVMWLWNWLMPALFGFPRIGIWHSLVILVLSSLLFE